MIPASPTAYRLLHDGTLALADVEAAGIRVDTDYLDRMIAKAKARVERIGAELMQDEVWKVWRRRYGNTAKLGSRDQLAEVLFGAMGHPITMRTGKKLRPSSDESHLATVDLPFVARYQEYETLKKAAATNLKGIRRHVVDGFAHVVYSLNIARTYRSCVAKGTMVEVVRDVAKHPRGIPIEDVKKGDFVYCYDDELNLTVRRVKWAGRTGRRRVVRVRWAARGKKGHLDVTPEHRIRLYDGRYVPACQLVGTYRGDDVDSHRYKIHALAMGRRGDRLWQTGRTDSLLDHRLVYESLIGPLADGEIVHHDDGNHLNNDPGNLIKTTQSEHNTVYHARFTDEIRRMGVAARVRNHRLYGGRFHVGDTLGFSNRFKLLRSLAEVRGRLTGTQHAFETIKKRVQEAGIDVRAIKDRYNGRGEYIALGPLRRAHSAGVKNVERVFGISYYQCQRLLKARGLSTRRRWANQFGQFVPGNHCITGVEELLDAVDVYDIEVEGCHNFIAAEICVHNSCSEFNFQNLPIRDPQMGKLIRRAFIPRDGNVLLEIDEAQVEVRVGACYHHDPRMIEYIEDTTKDMHRDMAAECFLLPEADLKKHAKEYKAIRGLAKGGFVFAEFYGDYYPGVAANLWGTAEKEKLARHDGTSIIDHLRAKGIRARGECTPGQEPRRGTFEAHIRDVEKRFWGQRFRGYAAWKKRWWEEYLKAGYFRMHTGFVCQGVYKRNEAVNYPIQGCLAGHCRVLTDEGHIPIRELVGRHVRVWTGHKWADAVGLDRGTCRRAVISLSSGLRIECDIRHKLKNENGEWLPFEKLVPGTLVALPGCGNPLPSSPGMNWWFLLGFLIGDGHLGGRGRRFVSITVGKKKLPILKEIRRFLISEGYCEGGYGGIRCRTIPAAGNKAKKYNLGLENRKFSDQLERLGIVFGSRARTKRVPEGVWRAGPQARRDFLEGIWMSDGCRATRGLNMVSRGLLRDIQQLAAGVGFDSVLYGNGARLNFHWREHNAKSPRKFPAASLVRLVSVVTKNGKDSGSEYVMSHRALAGARRGKDCSQYVAERCVERHGSGGEVYRYDRIESVRILDKAETTYTMSVDDPLHQFVADGVIHKNSAFHCLLWSIIQLNAWLRANKMRTRIVGQIHDSILLDAPEDEVADVVAAARRIMCRDILREWPWLIVPPEVEVEISRTNWYEKEKYV